MSMAAYGLIFAWIVVVIALVVIEDIVVSRGMFVPSIALVALIALWVAATVAAMCGYVDLPGWLAEVVA